MHDLIKDQLFYPSEEHFFNTDSDDAAHLLFVEWKHLGRKSLSICYI